MKSFFRFTALCLMLLLVHSSILSASAATARLVGYADGYLAIPNDEVTVSASSELKDQYGKYPATYANDANTRTTWAERASGNGEGEWLEFMFPEQNVIGFTIRAGYHKSRDVYRKNARPREILLTVGDEPPMAIELDDVREPQTVLFDQPVTTDYLTITLSTFYTGTKYKDTCITDVRVLTAGAEQFFENDSWQGRYRTFIRQHFPESYGERWPFMKLIDLNFDDVPELLTCIDDSHVALYHIVSSSDIDHWAELYYSNDFQRGDIFQLYREASTGEEFWTTSEPYSNQGVSCTSLSILAYSPANISEIPLFTTTEAFDPADENYGDKHFSYKGEEVSEEEYELQYQAFHDENEPVDFKMARCDEESNSVAEALANFDEMCENYG